MRHILFSTIFALLCVPAFISAQESASSPLIANPVYEKNCAKCHGKAADGRFMGGPSLTAEKVTSAPSDELRNFIVNGKGRMPKYSGKLSAADIDTLVQQIKAANKK